MTIEIALLFALIIAMIVLMALEKLPTDTLSVTLMVVLILGGFVTPEEGIAGMSNPATVTVLSLMILTVGLETTGVITALGNRLKGLLLQGEWKIILVLMVVVGCCSAFISTTAIVVVFLRILLKLSNTVHVRLTKLLIPLTFAGILGGSCTLLGTSTNLLVSAIAKDYNLKAFGVFEFSHLGVIFFAVGIIYMVFWGRHMLPKGDEEGDKDFAIQDYLTEIIVTEDCKHIGKKIENTPFFEDDELEIIHMNRGGSKRLPHEVASLEAYDTLMIKGSVEKIAKLVQNPCFTFMTRNGSEVSALDKENKTLCEVFIKPNSRIIGLPLNYARLKLDYNATPIAIKKNRFYFTRNTGDLTIDSGDTVLMEVGKAKFKQFYNLPEFVVLQEHEDLATKSNRRYVAATILVLVILLAATNTLSILESALAGCVAMFLTGCLDLQQAYRRVDWNVFFLLAGFIPLGTAMNNTGASELIADSFVDFFGDVTPRMLVGLLFFCTTMLSSIVSNNATAIIFAPIAVSIAVHLNLDPRPLLITVMFASNMSFMSPIGYQTNTLVYSTGQYKFSDFFKVGGILSLIIWILAIWLIPLFYF